MASIRFTGSRTLSPQQINYLIAWGSRDLDELLQQGYDNRDRIKEIIINRMYFQNRRYPNYGPPVQRRLITDADAEYIAESVLKYELDRMADGADDLLYFADDGFRNYKAPALTTIAMLVALGTLLYIVKK